MDKSQCPFQTKELCDNRHSFLIGLAFTNQIDVKLKIDQGNITLNSVKKKKKDTITIILLFIYF